jgi:hypothetical protein
LNNYINYIIFIIGLIIASVAGFYSVMGLAMIFAGAFWPIVVMASSIELAKVACTSWLSRYWSNSPATIRYYLTVAIIVLSLITSLGVFGFLSKAHITTTTVIGSSDIEVQTLEQQQRILNDRLKYLLKKAGDDPDRISKMTDSQIQQTQKDLVELNKKMLPLLQESNKMQAEIGPLKFVAELIYGSADRSIIESSVRLLIIIIVLVFDPLALIMILAANHGFRHTEKQQFDIGDGVVIDKQKIHEIDLNSLHTIK